MIGKSLQWAFLFVFAVAFVFNAAITVTEAGAATSSEKPKPSEPFAPPDQGALLRAAPRDPGERAPLAPGATITVPGDYATIQGAIDAAVTNDVITVAAGTYAEAIKIDGKDLTITGAGAGSTFITGDALNTTYIVFITGVAAVDFSGFTVDGSGKDIRYGVHADGYTGGDIHDNVIKNIVYPGALGLAVRRDDSYIDVTDNEIYGFGRIGIYTRDENILNTDTGVISGNTVTGLGGSDPDRINYGISCYYGNPTITGNNIYDCVSGANQGWASSGMDLWNGGTPNVTNNEMHDCDYGILVANCSPTLSGNTFSGITLDEVRLDYMVKGNPTASQWEWYDSIQDAVDAVPVTTYKSLVWLAVYSGSGTYEEQVVIDKNLRMYGNYSNTVIVAPVALTDYFTTSNNNYPIVYVHDADEVVINGLVVDGAGRGNGNYRFVGVGYHNAGGVVYAVDFLDVRDTPFSGSQHGVAMYLYNDDGTAREFYLGNCTFSGFQKNAIALSASATTALEVDVVGNTITGAGATDVTAQNGIQFYGDLITGTAAGNTVDGIAYDNTAATTKWCATSILNYFSTIEVTANTITGAHMGIYHYFGRGPIRENDLSIEKVGVSAFGVVTADPPDLVPSPFDAPEVLAAGPRGRLGAPLADVEVTVNSNTVIFSGTDNTDTWGIAVEAGYDADNITARADSNTVTGFEYGIEFWMCQSGCGTGLFLAGQARYNDLAGNDWGMNSNAGYITVDGTQNWWGHTSGPYHPTLNPDGLGSAVSDYILFEPFVQPAISVVPDYAITTCSDALTYEFIYDGTDVPDELRGFEITFSVDPAVTTVAALTDIVEGGFLGSFGSTQFFTSDEGGGVYKVSCAIYGGTTGATGTGTLFSVLLTPVAEGTSAIDITNVKLRDVDNAPISASITGGTIQVDCTPPTMKAIVEAEGGWYNTAPTFSVFGFDDDVNLDLAQYRIDSGDWVTIFSDIDAAEWNDHGWALPGFGGLTEGSHTVYFRVEDDAGNSNGEGTPDTYSWQFYKDTEPPAHPTDFVALPGHEQVHLTWTNPSGDATFAGVEIRRVAWGDYPQYGTPGPSAPDYPGNETAGALVVKADLTAYDDPIEPRDIYYYAAFAYDLAGNYSVFDAAAADRSTNYWLGDIASPYDGFVNYTDLVPFSSAFGSVQSGSGWNAEADFGPTDDWSRLGIPEPDDVVDFEDLMIFSMNYGHVDPLGFEAEKQAPAPEDLEALVRFELLPAVTDEGVVYSLVMTSEARTLKGASVVVHVEGAQAAAARGGILAGRSDVFFGVIERDGALEVCVAALGIDRPLVGSGEIARLVIRGESGTIAIGKVDLRDLENTCFELEGGSETEVPVVPEATALRGNYPNPFNPATTVAFDLARTGAVSIRIYDVSGRLVKTLVDKVMPAGRYDMTWDGMNSAGTHVPSGIYFCRMQTAEYSATSKMVLLR